MSKTAVTPTIKWHDFYCDPTDDLVIQSNNNMLFRASSWRLAEARFVKDFAGHMSDSLTPFSARSSRACAKRRPGRPKTRFISTLILA